MSACEYWEELICAEADGEITAEERAALSAHLEECEHCRRYRDAVAAMSAALKEDLAEAPETLSFAVMTKLAMQEELEERRAHPKRFTPRRVVGLAASLLIIAGVGLGLSRFQSGRSDAAAPQMMAMDSAAAAAEDAGSGEEMMLFAAAESAEAEEAYTAGAEGTADSADSVNGFACADSAAAPAEEPAPAPEARQEDKAEAYNGTDDPVLTAIVSAALDYVKREMPDAALTLSEPDTPEVVMLPGEDPEYFPALDGYQPQGERYAVTFASTAEVLGPLTVLVDETATVYGVLPRE